MILARSSLLANNSLFSGNSAEAYGGVMYTILSSILQLSTRTTHTPHHKAHYTPTRTCHILTCDVNTLIHKTDTTFINSTFLNNRGGSGGGIFYSSSSDLPVYNNCTFSNNTAVYGSFLPPRLSPSMLRSKVSKR